MSPEQAVEMIGLLKQQIFLLQLLSGFLALLALYTIGRG